MTWVITSMDNESPIDHLREKYPGAFEGWDGFEVNMETRNRQGEGPILKVCLHNKGTEGFVVDMHVCFLVTMDKEGQDVIRIGKHELAQEYSSAYIPEQYKTETDAQEETEK